MYYVFMHHQQNHSSWLAWRECERVQDVYRVKLFFFNSWSNLWWKFLLCWESRKPFLYHSSVFLRSLSTGYVCVYLRVGRNCACVADCNKLLALWIAMISHIPNRRKELEKSWLCSSRGSKLIQKAKQGLADMDIRIRMKHIRCISMILV